MYWPCWTTPQGRGQGGRRGESRAASTAWKRTLRCDVSDEEWALVAPYVTLMKEAAPQRRYAMREVFNGLRWLVRAGAPWRMLNISPVGGGVSDERWLRAGVFEALVHDLTQPSAAILDSRTLQSPESGGRAGWRQAAAREQGAYGKGTQATQKGETYGRTTRKQPGARRNRSASC